MGMTRQELYNMSELLIGCKNRIFISDDPKEIAYLYYSANRYLSTIYKENLDRAYAAQAQKQEQAEEKEQQFISPELNPEELPFG